LTKSATPCAISSSRPGAERLTPAPGLSTVERGRYILAAVCLFFLLVGAYALTYRGVPLSQDSVFIFDSVESLVRRGDFLRTYEYSKFNSGNFPLGDAPWPEPVQEPLVVVLAAPLFWIGQNIPQIGTMHTVWLFNIFITALTAVSLYGAGLLLGYPVRIAWIGGLTYGLATLTWPYARFLFREPLMALLTLWCFALALLIGRRWQTGDFPWRLALLLVAAFAGALLTKVTAVLLLPALLILLLPPLRRVRIQRRHLVISALIAAGLASVVIAVLLLDDTRLRYSPGYWLRAAQGIEWIYILESFLGYQVSPGRSVWLYSPVLLPGLAGAWMLFRRGQRRLVLSIALALLSLAAAYGVGHAGSWWGNIGWGPRYLLPVIPLLMLWVLPVLAALRSRLQWMAFAALFAVSAGMQLLGMAVPLLNYYTDLYRGGMIGDVDNQPPWGAYNWSWEWSPLRYHLTRLDPGQLDSAWQVAAPGWLAPLLAGILITAAAGMGLWLWRSAAARSIRPLRVTGGALTIALSLMTVITLGGGLYSLRHDPRYVQDWPEVYELIQDLNGRVQPDDAVFIDREQYLPLFMNYFKPPALTVALPYAPGEDYGDGPEIVDGSLAQRITPVGHRGLFYTGGNHDHVWLVASASPFEANKIRPMERYLVDRCYPVTEFATAQHARAIHYLCGQVFGPLTEDDPVAPTDYVFDERLALTGLYLPAGTAFAPGEIVPAALLWSPLAALPEDYNVSVQIATLDGVPLAQRDGQPEGTFGYMSRWQVGEHYRDSHGVQLPLEIEPGEYALQVIVYRWQDGARLPLTGGGIEGDVLPLARIYVE
jgi:hypothetical protein